MTMTRGLLPALLLHSLLAGAGVLLLLAVVFRKPRHLLLVLANLPFALVGGVLAVHFSGGLLTVEGRPWGLESALRGASERLVPVLMTALVTGLGLLPIAIGAEEAGREIEGPMALVILGGLATSTLLNLLVLPTLALRYGRFEPAVADQ